MAFNTELIKHTLPATLRFNPFHTASLLFKWEIKSLHIDSFLGLSPTLTPKNLNGSLSTLHTRKVEAASMYQSPIDTINIALVEINPQPRHNLKTTKN